MNTIPVIFKRYSDGEVIAVFPTTSWRLVPHGEQTDVTVYSNRTQHSGASVSHVKALSPATPEEIKALHKELRGQGYNQLRVVKRWRKSYNKERDGT